MNLNWGEGAHDNSTDGSVALSQDKLTVATFIFATPRLEPTQSLAKWRKQAKEAKQKEHAG